MCHRSPSRLGSRVTRINISAVPCPGTSLKWIAFTLEHPLPVEYKGIKRDCGYRMDILAENWLIIERKAVEEIKGFHKAHLLTYMKLSGFDTGLLINFNAERLKDGIQRFKI